MQITTFLLALLALIALATAQDMGTISDPPANATIAPGAVFNFTYNAHADYCKSSYGFAVYVVTEQPLSTTPADQFMSGYYFGHYEVENYPAVPDPTNPVPPNLTMPNFAESQGGFGAGHSVTNATFWITVLEEWDDCEGAIGRKIALAQTPIIYNATTTS